MLKNLMIHNRRKPGSRAQAMVEFAIVAPILFLMLIGIFEVGRMIFLYAAVTNASREAARFGSAIGYDDDGELRFKHCSKMRDLARKASYFTSIPDSAIVIEYDHGPGTSVFHTCPPGVDVEPGYFVNLVPGKVDRVIVTVTGEYSPFTSIIPWGTRNFSAKSARTILGYVTMAPGGAGSAGGSLPATATFTATEDPANPWTQTPTATEGPSPTPTDTATATETLVYWTFTPKPTGTATRTPTITPTGTNTNTPTITFTPTSTATPTATSTAVPGCNMITAGDINMSKQSNVMTMTITNPHTAVTVLNVQLKWNGAAGANGSNPLTWVSTTLGGVTWNAGSSAGTFISAPTSTVTIPGNNGTSTITITFDKSYANPIANGTTITINLSTPGCESYPITKTK